MGLKDLVNSLKFQFKGSLQLFIVISIINLSLFILYLITKPFFLKTYHEGELIIKNTTLDYFYEEVEYMLSTISESSINDNLVKQLPLKDIIEFGLAPSRYENQQDNINTIKIARSNDLASFSTLLGSQPFLFNVNQNLNSKNKYKERFKTNLDIRSFISNEFSYNDKIIIKVQYSNEDQVYEHLFQVAKELLDSFAVDLKRAINFRIQKFRDTNIDVQEMLILSRDYKDENQTQNIDLAIKMLEKTLRTVDTINLDVIDDVKNNKVLMNTSIKISNKQNYLPGTLEALIIVVILQFLLFSISNFLIRYYKSNKVI